MNIKKKSSIRVCKIIVFVVQAFLSFVLFFQYSYSETNDVNGFLVISNAIQKSRAVGYPIHTRVSIFREGLRPTSVLCFIGLYGCTNLVAYMPLRSQAFDARLFNSDGKEISKSFYDEKFGQSLRPDKSLLDGSFRQSLPAMYGHSRELDFKNCHADDTRYWDFDVLSSFRIKEPGEYRLQVQVRLFTKDTNGAFQPFILPPVETKVKMSESDLGK